MKYYDELKVIRNAIKEAYDLFANQPPRDVEQKSEYDLVTDIDKQIETYITERILESFPQDRIHAEETRNDTPILDRTWTIDPIDGTVNMARGIVIYGIQCSLIENDEIVLAAIYLNLTNEMIVAAKGCGCFLNDSKIAVNDLNSINNAVISFGDYPHKNSSRIADWQHSAIKKLYGNIAKIRMFGAACVDFAFVAAGRTDATVVITTNIWDIAPGILACREAGAIVLGLDGEEFTRDSEGVIAACNKDVADLLVNSFRREKKINRYLPDKEYEAVLFDFDGVILNTEKYHLESWNKAFEEYNICMDEEYYLPLRSTGGEYIVNKLSDVYGLALSDEDKARIREKKKETYFELIKQIGEKDFIPGVIEYLEYLKAHFIRIGVVSSSRELKKQLVDFNIIKYFDVIVDGYYKGKKKPDPEMFLFAADSLRIRPDATLVFEDSYAGIESGVAGGFDVIGVGKIQSDKTIANIEDFKAM